MKARFLVGSFVAAAMIFALPVGAMAKAKPYGYVQQWFAVGDAGSGGVDSTFLSRRARMGLKGKYGKIVKYKVIAGFAESPSDTSKLLDAVIYLKFSPLATLGMGQYKPTLDMEGRASSSDLPLVVRPVAASKTVKGAIGSSYRTAGVHLKGKQKGGVSWGYEAGYTNGQSINSLDGNDDKAIYASAYVKPMKGLKVQLAYWNNAAPSSGTEKIGYTASVQGKFGPVIARAEYYTQDHDSGGTTTVEDRGYYVLAGYQAPAWEVLGRYQVYEDDLKTSSQFTSFDVGGSYYFKRGKGTFKGQKVSLVYMVRDAEKNASSKVWQEKGAKVKGDAVENVAILMFQVAY